MAPSNAKDTTSPDIEAHVLRFSDLPGRESAYRPIDMLLKRFERKRYAVVSRPAEQNGRSTPLDQVDTFNITYLKCEPGMGLATHGHSTPEAFIVMAGRWKITFIPNKRLYLDRSTSSRYRPMKCMARRISATRPAG